MGWLISWFGEGLRGPLRDANVVQAMDDVIRVGFPVLPPGDVALESVIAHHLSALVGNVAAHRRYPFERMEYLDLSASLGPVAHLCRLPI